MSVRKSLAWSFSQQFFQYGSQIIASIIIARLLLPEELGIFALAMSTTVLLSNFRAFGVNSYLIREKNLTDDKIRSAFGVMIIISWTLGIVLLFSRPLLVQIYEEPGISDIVALTSVNFFLAPFGAPANALLARDMRFDLLHHITLIASVVGTVVSVALAYLGFSYMSLGWGLVASSGISAVCYIIAKPDHIKLMPSLKLWREIFQFGGLLSVTSLLGTINSEGVKFILGALTNPAKIAQFERASQIPSLYREALFGPVGRVMIPSLSKNIRENQSIGDIVEKIIGINTILVWPVFMALSLIAQPVIVLIFGENWRPAGHILPLILLSQGILALIPQVDQILVPWGKVKILLYAKLCTVTLTLVLSAFGAYYGLLAFALTRPIASAFGVFINYMAMRRYLELSPERVIKQYAKASFVALLCLLPALGFRLMNYEELSLLNFILVIMLSAMLWIAGIALTKHFLWREALDFLSRFIRR